MSLLIVGSLAYDAISTPFGNVDRILGGSASYASLAASLFTPPTIVGVVGDDFANESRKLLLEKGIALDGVENAVGKTFFWEGSYGHDLNTAVTHKTELGVFADFSPTNFSRFEEFPLIFLGNIDPELQYAVLEKARSSSPFVALDSMNYWIETKREALEEVISKVSLVFLNESEIRQLTGDYFLPDAANNILQRGPQIVVVKLGSYGAVVFAKEDRFVLPSYLLDHVVDPTGAGDSFAGGVMGYLAQQIASGKDPREAISFATVQQAVVQGTVVASFTVEDFGPQRLATVQLQDIQSRRERYRNLTNWE